MPLPKITVRSLKALLAVYEEQSFSLAAERENATQSGMSTQVKKLEEALGTQLLLRGRGEIDLTPAGRLLYGHGQGILRDLFTLEENIAALDSDVAGEIRCGIIPTLTRAVLPHAIEALRTDHPRIRVTVIEEYSFSLMQRVLTGDLDCAAVPAGDILNGLTATYLGRDSEVLVAPATFRPDLPTLSPVRPKDLDDLKLILPSSINVRRRALDTYFASHQVTLSESMDMDAMLGTLELIAASDWCAVLPSALVMPDIRTQRRKLHPLTDPPIFTEYVLVQKAERALHQPAALFAEVLATSAKSVRTEWERLTDAL